MKIREFLDEELAIVVIALDNEEEMTGKKKTNPEKEESVGSYDLRKYEGEG